MENILVALDGSPLAEKGIETAIATAKQDPGSRIILMTVLETKSPDDTLHYVVRRYLDNLVAKYGNEGVNMQAEITHGIAAEEIVRYAESKSIDLIVLTTRGRSGLKKFLLGSVAEKIITTSSVPILVCPPEKQFRG